MKKTIKFWSMLNGTSEYKNILEKEINLFNNANKRIHVEYRIINWSYSWNRIIECIKIGEGPDVIQVGSTWTSQLAVLNGFKTLNKRIKEIDKNQFSPGAWQACKIKSSYISVPWITDLRILFYRKDILDKYNLNVESIKTWEGYYEACKKIHSNAMTAIIIPKFQIQLLVHEMAIWLWNFGGDFLSEDGKQSMISSKNSIEGLKYYFNLINNFCTQSKETRIIQDLYFYDMNHCFMISGLWTMDKFLNPEKKSYKKEYDEKVGITLIPRGPKAHNIFLGGSNLSIMKYSKNFDEAFELIKYFVSKDTQSRFCAKISMPPANTLAIEDALQKNKQYNEIIIKSYQLGRSLPVNPLWGAIEILLSKFMKHIISIIFTGNYKESILIKNCNRLKNEIEYILKL